MDQCSGQMDVYEVLDDIEKRGLVPVSGNQKNSPTSSDDELAEIVMRGVHLVPLWNRPSSPK